jgi:alcohol dehydrogenase
VKAAVCTGWGPPEVLRVTEVRKPAPLKREVCIVDAVGRRKSAKALLRAGAALAPGGKSISIDDDFPKPRADDLLLLKRLAESGDLQPVIDRTYPLDEIVEAHRYVDAGHKRGNVIVTIGPADT